MYGHWGIDMGMKFAGYDETGSITAFYDSEDSPPPAGANVIAITYDEWLTCIASQQYRVADLRLVPPAPPTSEAVTAELSNEVRERRNRLLSRTDWLVLRHRDQLANSGTTTLTPESFAALLSYRQALRDLPLQPGFPDQSTFPTVFA